MRGELRCVAEVTVSFYFVDYFAVIHTLSVAQISLRIFPSLTFGSCVWHVCGQISKHIDFSYLMNSHFRSIWRIGATLLLSRDSQLNYTENYKNLRCLWDSQWEIIRNTAVRIILLSWLKAVQLAHGSLVWKSVGMCQDLADPIFMMILMIQCQSQSKFKY